MRMLIFARRTAKEIMRDPLNLVFGLGFPLVLLFLLSLLQRNIPADLYIPESLTPGLAVFGLAFFTLFSSTLLAKDRTGAFLQRLYTTPLTAKDFILGYMLPLLPMALAQSLICYAAALSVGLPLSGRLVPCVLCAVPMSLFYISLGLLCGSVLNDKQVGGICGALVTNLTAWLSGTFFDLDLIGGGFKKVCYLLPFAHGSALGRSILAGNTGEALGHLWWVLGWGMAMTMATILVFTQKMKN